MVVEQQLQALGGGLAAVDVANPRVTLGADQVSHVVVEGVHGQGQGIVEQALEEPIGLGSQALRG